MPFGMRLFCLFSGVLVGLLLFVLPTEMDSGNTYGQTRSGSVLKPASGWYPLKLYPGQFGYWDGYDYVVQFNPATLEVWFFNKETSRWSEPVTPTIAAFPPDDDLPLEEYVGDLPTGVMIEELEKSKPGFAVNGQQISEATAKHLVEEGLPNEIGKGWITAVGPPAFLAQVELALGKVPVADRLLYQGYEPTEWVVDRFALKSNPKFQTTGQAIIIQAPNGKAVHMQYDAGDQESFSKALTEAVAAFDATKVPDLRDDNFLTKVTRWAKENPLLAAVCVIAAFLFLYGPQKDEQ